MDRQGYFKGIIFDFNGTMFRDNEFHIRAWIEFAARYGAVMSRETYLADFHGLASQESLERLLDRTIDTETGLQMQEEKEAIYRQMCLDNPEQFILAPGLVELLNTLAYHKFPMAIATASAQNNVNFFIEQFQLERWFVRKHVVFDDGTFRNKPAPDIYLRTAERLGIDPGRLVVVEDSKIGASAAKNAGIGQIILTGEELFAVDSLTEDFPEGFYITDFNDIPLGIFI